MSRTIFIGDVHGCLKELQELICKIHLHQNDHLVFVGDLIHKGPDSTGVLEYVLNLTKTYKVDIICGNHEEKHLRWLKTEASCLKTNTKNTMLHVEEYPSVNVSSEVKELLENTYIAKKYNNTVAVHAGIPSNLLELKCITHAEWSATSGKQKRALAQVMRVRFLAGPNRTSTNSKGKTKKVQMGKMIALGQEKPEDNYWANVYDGRFGTVVFGHNPFMENKPRIFPYAFGVDLGCVHGGYLCALIKKNKTTTHVVVKAKQTYQKSPSWIYKN